MNRKIFELRTLSYVILCLVITIHFGKGDEVRSHPNHRNSLMTMSDLANHWIGIPKSPYLHYTATVSSTTASAPPPTSAPVSVKRVSKLKPKKKKRKIDDVKSKRRSDADYSRNRDRDYYSDMDESQDYDYDYDNYRPSYARARPTSPPLPPYVVRGSSSPQTMYMSPSESSPSVNKIFAAVPKVATYVVPSSKTYVVQRVKSESVYVPPSNKYSVTSGMRRQDPLDFDDGGSNMNLNLGPQNSFPPRPVMNQIAGQGQRQPCHGPECHQHHKGLVRFYWRRVIYPPGADGRRRRPARFRNRRRFRDRSRSPSDQSETYISDEEEEEDAEDEEDTIDHDDDPEEDEDEEESEDMGNRRQVWRPGKAYGHDHDEGKYYTDNDRKVYRDKRYAFRQRMRPRIVY